MLDSSGGFYSTQDADSEGEEGKFFVWKPEEIEQILNTDDARTFCAYYDVTKEGNFEGHNILNIKNPKIAAPADHIRAGVFKEREKRIKPNRDEKVLTAWNGLMLAAFADAAAVLANEQYLEIAIRNAEFIEAELQRDGRLFRTWKEGKAKLNGYLEDYANVADGLVVLYQVSADIKYLAEAKRLADLMITEFWDGENGGFYFTSNDHEELIVRNKDLYDNATPSGNSVAADVLLRLTKLLGDEKYERFAIAVLRLTATQLRRHPQGFGRALSALEFYLGDTKEIAVIGEKGNELEREVLGRYLPNTVIAISDDPERDSELIPLFRGRNAENGRAAAFVCENFVCQRPVNSVDELVI